MTEPASNMPAKSFGIRNMNAFMFEADGKLNYHNGVVISASVKVGRVLVR